MSQVRLSGNKYQHRLTDRQTFPTQLTAMQVARSGANVPYRSKVILQENIGSVISADNSDEELWGNYDDDVEMSEQSFASIPDLNNLPMKSNFQLSKRLPSALDSYFSDRHNGTRRMSISSKEHMYSDEDEEMSDGSIATNPPSPILRPAEGRRALVPTLSAPALLGWNTQHKVAPLDLAYTIIAHSSEVQRMMDLRKISWGVQYEIARGVSTGTWEWSDVTSEKISKLVGSELEKATSVPHVIRPDKFRQPRSASQAEMELWAELQREQKAIVENAGRGVGLMGEWDGIPNWYGGKIQQVASLRPNASDDSFSVRLERLESRKSTRFARFLGSRRLLQLRIVDDLVVKRGDAVREFLVKKFILCGRVFVPFHAKSGSIYMVETNEDHERRPDSACGDNSRMSLEDFVEWHNPLGANSSQPISKWSTRWALGVSTSVPVLEFMSENIYDLEDVVAPFDLPGKPPAETILTDGCGFINRAALLKITQLLSLPTCPTAVQGRIRGAKGLWILHPQDRLPDQPPRIWIRPSQNKIKYPDGTKLDKARLTFDLVCPNRVPAPARLSKYVIMNLSNNEVPAAALESLLKAGLEAEVCDLTDWTHPRAMSLLYNAVSVAGGISSLRLQRCVHGTGRALGFGREMDEEKQEIAADDGDAFDYHDPGRKAYSGEPLTVYEHALELIAAGFKPQSSKLLYDKLKYVLTNTIDKYIKQYRIPVPESAEAFIIPDPSGTLEEGQIYFRSSVAEVGLVTGEVLVYRNPTRLASDVQKVEAVNCPALFDYVDVIVFPTKGKRSLASYLAGGDYDGDTVAVIWSQVLVGAFSNAKFMGEPPKFLETNFEHEVETIPSFQQRTSPLSIGNRKSREAFQTVLLNGLTDPVLGQYSRFHDWSVYYNGHSHPSTVRLAYMFTTCLDAGKTGHRVRNDVFRSDRATYGGPLPSCMETADEKDPFLADSSNVVAKPRNPRLRTFILDGLHKFGKVEKDCHLQAYEAVGFHMHGREDPDLLKPYKDIKGLAKDISTMGVNTLELELSSIEDHVRQVQIHYREVLRKEKPKLTKASSGKKQKVAVTKDEFLEVARNFAHGPKDDATTLISQRLDIASIKASFAYSLSPPFATQVAFRDICLIKSRAVGAMAFTLELGEMMGMSSSLVRALKQTKSEARDSE